MLHVMGMGMLWNIMPHHLQEGHFAIYGTYFNKRESTPVLYFEKVVMLPNHEMPPQAPIGYVMDLHIQQKCA